MPKKLSRAEQRELEYRGRAAFGSSTFLVQHSDEPFPSAPELRDTVEQTGRAGDLRGMRIIRSEFLDMSRALPNEHQRALAELLKAQAADDPFPANGTVSRVAEADMRSIVRGGCAAALFGSLAA